MLTLDQLFNLKYTEHASLFDEVQYPWEVIPKIEEYIIRQLEEIDFDSQVYVGQGTVIEDGAVIKGPAIIGKNCVIRSGAYLRGRVILGDGVTVGQASELKNCLVFDDAQIPHLSYVGDSILGHRAHLGAGVVLSNVKTPPSEIKVKRADQEFPTGLEKFGALIGDYSEIGCSSVLNPGSVIGRNCLLYPLTNWRGVLEPDSLVKVRQTQEIVVKKQ